MYFGTTTTPPLVSSGLSSAAYDPPGDLLYETTYYWYIVAFDDHGHSTNGPVWSFTTLMSQPPYMPSNPTPADGAIDQPINGLILSWTGGDPEGDIVTYSVYLDTDPDPALYDTTQVEQYNLGTLEYDTTYYWNIISTDSYGHLTEGPVWSFTTLENLPPVIPNNPSPADGTIDLPINGVTLSWTCSDPESDPLTYDVYFGDTVTPPIVAAGLADTSHIITDTFEYETTYYWKIVAKDSYGHTTEGPVWSFTTIPNFAPATPSDPMPTDGQIDLPIAGITLGWTSSDIENDPLYYDLHFGTDPDPPMIAFGLTTDTYSMPWDLEYGTTYYWKIIVHDTYGHTTEGPIWSFTTIFNLPPDIPSNPNPADLAIDVSILTTLSWTCSDPESDPITYDVYFGINPSPSLVATGLTDTTYDPPGDLLYETDYFWKIVAHDSYGHTTEGLVWSFTTLMSQPPYMPSNPTPADGTIDLPINGVILGWTGGDPEGEPVTYDIYFGIDSDPPIRATGITSTTYQIFDIFEYGTTYYWKIIARDIYDHTAEGPVWQFTIIPNFPPSVPSDPVPVNGSVDLPIAGIVLGWSCSDPEGGPLTFDVYFGTDPSPPLVTSGLTDFTYALGTLEYGTDYYWKIVAHDDYGHITEGPVWEFSTIPNFPPSVPSDPIPPDGSIDLPISGITLGWTCTDPEDEPLIYDIYFGTDPDPPFYDTVTTNSYLLPVLDYDTTYYWKIIAQDTYGHSTEGPIWQFSIVPNYPPTAPDGPDPADGATNIDVFINLSWISTDPEGEDITYDIYFGKISPPPLLASGHPESTYDPGKLNYTSQYYWQVVAWDTYGNSNTSDEWEFTTRVLCGDMDNDEKINIVDLTYLVAYLFQGGPAPQPYACVGDVNNDGTTNIVDVTFMVAYLFQAGPAPLQNCCDTIW